MGDRTALFGRDLDRRLGVWWGAILLRAGTCYGGGHVRARGDIQRDIQRDIQLIRGDLQRRDIQRRDI